jgi:dUTP pyrophosphatase
MKKLKFKKLSEKAQTPTKAFPSDAGWDLVATSRAIRPFYIEYGTDLQIELPEGHVGLLFPRSSVSNKPLSMANSVGVIDQNFRGEIRLRFRKTVGAAVHTDSEAELYKVGDRIGQLVVMELPKIELEEIKEVSKTDRNEGGFGSSDFKEIEKKISKKVSKKVVKKDDMERKDS